MEIKKSLYQLNNTIYKINKSVKVDVECEGVNTCKLSILKNGRTEDYYNGLTKTNIPIILKVSNGILNIVNR